MKKTLYVLCLLVTLSLTWGCGGSPHVPAPTPTPSPVATPAASPTPTPPTLTANDVFHNVPQKWEFVSHCQNLNSDGTRGPLVEAHSWIDVMPKDATHTTWHYTKDQACAYWMDDGISAELYFELEQDSTGAWYSTGGHIIAPYGFPWDVNHAPQDFTYEVTYDQGMPRPYLIIPAMSTGVLTVVDKTTFPDTDAHTPWETDSLTEFFSSPFYTGWTMASIQQEGRCPASCAHEVWLFGAGGVGLVQVTPISNGGPPLDPRLTMLRVK